LEENEQIPDPVPDGDDSKWIWGILYFNPDDPRIFPPKRIAWMGWTINFANPYSIGAFLLLFLGIIFLGKFVRG